MKFREDKQRNTHLISFAVGLFRTFSHFVTCDMRKGANNLAHIFILMLYKLYFFCYHI